MSERYTQESIEERVQDGGENMVKYLLVVVGGLIFLAGYSFMKKNEGSGKTMRIYALFAYAGLSLIILAGARYWIQYLHRWEAGPITYSLQCRQRVL